MKGELNLKPKTINSLMSYMRDTHCIDIRGSKDKNDLKNIGYYHGFKGYRFIKNPNNRIEFTNFSEIKALYEFDANLKTLFYKYVMFLETAIKNHVLEVVLIYGKTENFVEIYDNCMIKYKSYERGSRNYQKSISKRLKVRNKIYNNITQNYAFETPVIVHFYHKEHSIPIWAIFETLTLGEFGDFISCLDDEIKIDIRSNLHIDGRFDSNNKLIESIIFIMRDLRNYIAHNNIIFDTRFNRRNINNNVIQTIEISTGVSNITFNNILDYLVLIIYLMNNLHSTKTELKNIIKTFEKYCNELYKSLPYNLYSQIIHTDSKNKLNKLKNYITKTK